MNETTETTTETFGSLEMTKLREEQSRTYLYPDGQSLTFAGVTHLHVKKGLKGDSHRLRLSNGDMVYVAPGWRAITFTGLREWTL